MNDDASSSRHDAQAPLGPVLTICALLSMGTGLLWGGIPFIARIEYGYTQIECLVMMLCTGAVYVIPAFWSGRVERWTGRIMSVRTLLQLNIGVQSAAAILPMITNAQVALWTALLAQSVLAALMWPIIESYVTAGRHGNDMRRAIGWFNVVWMTSVCIFMWLLGPLLAADSAVPPRMAVAGMALFFVPAIAIAWMLPRRPGAHDDVVAARHVPDSYRSLLAGTRVLLPLSYVLSATLAPLMPYVLSRLQVQTSAQSGMTSAWMIARVAAVVLMWWLPFWHGRWSALFMCTALMGIGFTMVIIGPVVAVAVCGMVLLGAGFGIAYYAALYYVMSVGRAGVDAGGAHEGVIGLGYAAGPLLGLIAAGGNVMTDRPPDDMAILSILAWVLIAIATAFVIRAWRGSHRHPDASCEA